MEYQLQEKYSTTSTKTSNNLIIPATTTCITKCSCFLCIIMSETVPSLRRAKIARYFKQMPHIDDQEHILALCGLWKIAVTKPNDSEFPSLGIFRCMAKLIQKGVNDKDWLLRHQNIYIPYYAAHIIGSYTMNKVKFADKAVKSNVIQPLMELLRGKISWVEQRVALRALGHLATHEATFEAVAEHEAEIIETAIDIASTCLEIVYENFVGLKESERLEYHKNLLTRGHGGLELENRKAEEWASQLQCWSLYLIDCFACRERERSIRLICKNKQFLKCLCGMRGGLANPKSPAGIGLLRTLSHTQIGRESIAELQEVIVHLCNVSRSSDDRQNMAIESILQLLRDPITRYKVIDIAAPVLADLVELRSLGQAIMQTLLQDYHKIKFCNLNLMKKEITKRVLEELWDSKVDRVKRESLMSEQEKREKQAISAVLKREGNQEFWSGNMEKAVMKYSEALNLCPIKNKKQRIVLYSNRAQCHLVIGDAESAISDSTRALCLSLSFSVERLHRKSLWRRAQGYDMKGLSEESLMDCMAFISTHRFETRQKRKGMTSSSFKVPYYVARLVNKQMNATWLFAASTAKSGWCSVRGEPKDFMDGNKIDATKFRKKTRRRMKVTIMGTANYNGEETLNGKRVKRKSSQRRKGVSENVCRSQPAHQRPKG